MRSPVGGAALCFLVLSACSPLTVKQVEPIKHYNEQIRNSLSSTDVSELTRTTLRRHDLLDRYEKEPEACIRELHAWLLENTGGEDEIFALAELSLVHAAKIKSHDHFLAAAVYAYAFLFPQHEEIAPDPLDTRVRVACDIYNRAIAEAFRGGKGNFLSLKEGTYALPFGLIDVSFDDTSLEWHGHRLMDLEPVGRMQVKGLRNQYRTPGIGAPLAARPEPIDGKYEDDGLIGKNIRVPITTVLLIDEPRLQIRSELLRGKLEIHSTDEVESIRIGDRNVTLEAEPTAVLANTLEAGRPWEQELAGFLGKAFNVSVKPTLLRATQPYHRGKIPVVFVHGTASSAFRWADMYNDLKSNPRIRQKYQFWFFAYDSGNPILYSAYKLRKALMDQVRILDPAGTDAALREMIVIGHSQGGLLTKLTGIDSGNVFWEGVSSKPFAEANLSEKNRELLQDAMFVKPLPFVKRLIFIATPHRGSYLAGPQLVRRLAERLVQLPSDVVGLGTELAGITSSSYISFERLPTSIDNMSPGNRFIRALAEIPVVRGIKTHSIIPVRQEEDIENGNDGVVEYKSAHITPVDSELVVHDSHSTQSNPHTIAEVERILLEHAELK